MDIRKLQKIVVSALEDVKGVDIAVINTVKLTSLFDRIVIATGTSNRQVKALARNVYDKVKEAGGEVNSIEGEDGGEWVLVDLGDIVVHVMQANVRAYYDLEELWQAKPSPAKREKASPVGGERGSSPQAKKRTPSPPSPRGEGGDQPAAKKPAARKSVAAAKKDGKPAPAKARKPAAKVAAPPSPRRRAAAKTPAKTET